MRRIESAEKQRQIEFALEQARYETARARRQYDAVDPDNRLVAGELERRWNERLLATRALEDERDALSVKSDRPIRPGGCSWRKITSRWGPLRARHLAM